MLAPFFLFAFLLVFAESPLEDENIQTDTKECRDDCTCPSRQSLIFRSSAEPPYCQRISFSERARGCRETRFCPSGYVLACFGAVATHRTRCPRVRRFGCPAGEWLVRGTRGRWNCLKVVRPRRAALALCRGTSEYAACIRVRPTGHCNDRPVGEEAFFDQEIDF